MVDGMSVAQSADPWHTPQKSHGQPTVHEAVVYDDVGEPEQGHAYTRSDADRRRMSLQITSNHDQRSGDGGMGGGEGVVPLEPPAAPAVMRAMDAPKRSVPHATVKHARPRLHGRRDDQRDRRAHQPRHETTS